MLYNAAGAISFVVFSMVFLVLFVVTAAFVMMSMVALVLICLIVVLVVIPIVCVAIAIFGQLLSSLSLSCWPLAQALFS